MIYFCLKKINLISSIKIYDNPKLEDLLSKCDRHIHWRCKEQQLCTKDKIEYFKQAWKNYLTFFND